MKIKCSLLQFPSIPGSQIAFFLQLHFWSCISGCLFLCWSLCGNPTWSNHLSSWNPTFCSVKPLPWKKSHPRCSMYGIFTYIWAIFVVNVGKSSIHDHTWSIWALVKSQFLVKSCLVVRVGQITASWISPNWATFLQFLLVKSPFFHCWSNHHVFSGWMYWNWFFVICLVQICFFATCWYILLLKSR